MGGHLIRSASRGGVHRLGHSGIDSLRGLMAALLMVLLPLIVMLCPGIVLELADAESVD